MKRLLYLVVFVSVLFFSCKENMPFIPDAPVIDSNRKVLVEEFTGVQCVNCPQGSIELENLLSIYGQNLVVVSIHAGDFVNKLPESMVDFKTPEGESLINYLGNPLFYPSAVIDRKDFNGGSYNLQSSLSKWAGYIDIELQIDPKISVNITKEYDYATRELSVQVSGIAQENLNGELRLTIMITENNIVDAQDVQGVGVVTDYVHRHAFRTTMTNFDGDSFASQLGEGDNYERTYSMQLPEDWNADECDVVAFVSLVDEPQFKEVLQVEQAHVVD